MIAGIQTMVSLSNPIPALLGIEFTLIPVGDQQDDANHVMHLPGGRDLSNYM